MSHQRQSIRVNAVSTFAYHSAKLGTNLESIAHKSLRLRLISACHTQLSNVTLYSWLLLLGAQPPARGADLLASELRVCTAYNLLHLSSFFA